MLLYQSPVAQWQWSKHEVYGYNCLVPNLSALLTAAGMPVSSLRHPFKTIATQRQSKELNL